MRFRVSAPLICLTASLAVLAAVGCSKVSPVTPSGTTITLTANPSFISSSSGSSTITAVVRKPNGTPVANGTEVRFTVDLGTISPIVATTGSDGIATATLRADGRLGKATVSALVGGGSTATTLAVNIGNVTNSKTITLQADPPSISQASGGTVRLLALVRDAQGLPQAGAGVNFLSPVGSLRSGGAIVVTDANGQAIDVLTVTSAQLITQTQPFTVTAETPANDGSLLMATFSVAVLTTAPHAAFHVVQAAGSQTVQFVNDSTPTTGLTFQWSFGDGANSTEPDPSHTYTAPGTYTVSLVATNSTTGQASEASAVITVPPK